VSRLIDDVKAHTTITRLNPRTIEQWTKVEIALPWKDMWRDNIVCTLLCVRLRRWDFFWEFFGCQYSHDVLDLLQSVVTCII
jgi:hypothetical protein